MYFLFHSGVWSKIHKSAHQLRGKRRGSNLCVFQIPLRVNHQSDFLPGVKWDEPSEFHVVEGRKTRRKRDVTDQIEETSTGPSSRLAEQRQELPVLYTSELREYEAIDEVNEFDASNHSLSILKSRRRQSFIQPKFWPPLQLGHPEILMTLSTRRTRNRRVPPRWFSPRDLDVHLPSFCGVLLQDRKLTMWHFLLANWQASALNGPQIWGPSITAFASQSSTPQCMVIDKGRPQHSRSSKSTNIGAGTVLLAPYLKRHRILLPTSF
ncbi:hypothetical protein K438DRAFT_1765147 [Mycena galopus ATCC 62051]|nr:hypothetical protein K438DRAFT_1765147 [Mycena galopus ATCC 62051]